MSRRKTSILLIVLLIISLLLNAYLLIIKIHPELEIHFNKKIKPEDYVGVWKFGNEEITIRSDGVVYMASLPYEKEQEGYYALLKGKIIDNVIVIDKILNEEAYYKKNGKHFKREVPFYAIQDECFDDVIARNILAEKGSDNTLTIDGRPYVRKDE